MRSKWVTLKTINEGETLNLLSDVSGNAVGGVFITISINNSDSATTNENYTGELTITKLDFTNHIVSGTFWYNIKNPYTNETIEIREGRFDTLFTQ